MGYVGMTAFPMKHRWQRHVSVSRYRAKTPLHLAIKKYGEDKFSIEQIASATCWTDACEVEKLLIKELGCHHPKGFNLAIGGGGKVGAPLSDETRQKLSKAFKGRKMSEESRRKMSESAKKRRATPETRKRMSLALLGKNAGKKHSAEVKLKMSLAKRGRTLSDEQKKKLSSVWGIPGNRERFMASRFYRCPSAAIRKRCPCVGNRREMV